MQMNWQTMKRNGEVFAAIRDLLNNKVEATKMTVACRSGYSESQTEKAMISIHKQGAIVIEDGRVARTYTFTQPLPHKQRTPAPEHLP